MEQGTIRTLVHLSNQTELPATNIVRNHNYRGYGYIKTSDDTELYFDHESVEPVNGLGFGSLAEGDRVLFELDETEPKKAKIVHKDV